MNELMASLVAEDRGHPQVASGDTVKVHVRIVEGDRKRFVGPVPKYCLSEGDAPVTLPKERSELRP